MPTASALRIEIERSLEHRFPAALTPAPRSACEFAATGVAEVDELFGGGLPVGAISEITGTQSSGRTSIACAFLAQRTRDGQVCAWVDANDAFDPESAAAAGVALPQLLWVRCNDAGANLKRKQYARLDQALQATDLLLQNAGFGAIMLDLGNTAEEHARRIPLATWFRFRQAAQRSRTSLVVLGQTSYAQSSAEVVLECTASQIPIKPATVLNALQFQVHRHRRRFRQTPAFSKKPSISDWTASSAWNQGTQK